MNVCRIVGAPNVLEVPGEPIIAFGTIGTSVVGQDGGPISTRRPR